SAEPTERIEEVTMTNEFDPGTASNTSQNATEVREPTQGDVADNPSDTAAADEDLVEDDLDRLTADETTESLGDAMAQAAQEEAADATASSTQDKEPATARPQVPKRTSSAQFEDAELGALMAEIVRPGAANALEEQQQLQARFRDPEESRAHGNAAAFVVPSGGRQTPEQAVAIAEALPDATPPKASPSVSSGDDADLAVPPGDPTEESTAESAAEPTSEPAAEITAEPAAEITAEPTAEPTVEPTAEPTAELVEPSIDEPETNHAEAPAAESAGEL